MNKSLKEEMIKLFDDGYNYTQIANKLNCSKGTISHHLSSFVKKRKKEKKEFLENIKNNLPTDRETFIKLYNDKLTHRERQYFFNNFYKIPNANSLIDGKISNEYHQKRRLKVKQEMVDYKGGSCEVCGYNKSLRALQFHHKNPKEKDFTISSKNMTMNDEVKKELDKCMLVCANCHSEIHDNNLNKANCPSD